MKTTLPGESWGALGGSDRGIGSRPKLLEQTLIYLGAILQSLGVHFEGVRGGVWGLLGRPEKDPEPN